MITTGHQSHHRKHHLQNKRNVLSLLTSIGILAIQNSVVQAWNGNDDGTEGIFSASRKSQWLYSSSAIAIEYHGCTWDYADNTDDAGCLAADSEDGLESWYLMANCRRAQAIYSVYSTENSNNLNTCSKDDYVGTYVTKNGYYGFLSYLSGYDEYPLITGDDDAFAQDYLPMCEQDQNGNYVSVGCSESGELTLDKFSDQYCLSFSSTYKSLDTISTKLGYYKNCHQVYSAANGNAPEYSMVGYMLPYSEGCNQLDSPHCYDIDGSKSKSLKATSDGSFQKIKHYTGTSFASKMKYALGCFFLVSSLLMFIGILVTNRRKRRAMLQKHLNRLNESGRRRHRSRSGRPDRRSRRSKSNRRRRETAEHDEEEGDETGGTMA